MPSSAQRLIVLFLLLVGPSLARAAAQKDFILSGNSVSLQDVSADIGVRYQSMRLNRARNEWNVEVILTNHSSRTVRGPFVLIIDSVSGTSGVLNPDGLVDTAPAKAFFNLGSGVPGTNLVAGAESQPRTLALALGPTAPQLVTRVFADPSSSQPPLALARSLDQLGHPLAEVIVQETGPSGGMSYRTESESGNVALGQGAGDHRWKFSRTGFLPVFRQAHLDSVVLLSNPRLVPRDTNEVQLTPVGGGQIQKPQMDITFGPGAFDDVTAASLTLLSGQTLPAMLPSGWSPLQAFWIELSRAPLQPGQLNLAPWSNLQPGETAVLAHWDEALYAWVTVGKAAGNGNAPLHFSLPASGGYVLAIADPDGAGPAIPDLNQPLPAGGLTLADFSVLKATGKVTPAVRPASRNSDLVTASAEVVISNATVELPSGLELRCEVSETYELLDGSRRTLPRYETFITGYQKPGDANAKTLHALFPIRPILLFGTEELLQATVTIDVLVPRPFGGKVLGSEGGEIAAAGDGSVRVLLPAGTITNRLAGELRMLETTNFALLNSSNLTVVRAFELDLRGSNDRLRTEFGALAPNQDFLLARVLVRDGLYGLEPLERFQTDAAGLLSSREPVSGDRLPGLTGSGQFVLVQLAQAQGLISGHARDAGGNTFSNAPVQIGNQSWLAFSGPGGNFFTVGSPGTVPIILTDPRTGDSRTTTVVIGNPQTPVSVDITLAPSAPRILNVSPADQAARVPRVSPVVITFSEPINLGSVTSNSIRLLGTNLQPVAASLSFNLRGNVATLLPTEELAPRTLHTVSVSTNLSDFSGLRLEGANQFVFTTVNAALDRGSAAQLITYEPTNGLVRMVGSQGIADPGKAVILVNDTSGRTSTVLSQPDGSFSGSVEAEADDILYAVFVNENGTRNQISVSKQVFADGSVGIFNAGGVIEAQGEDGPMQLIIEPGSISKKAVFKIEPVALSNAMAALHGVQPENGGRVLGGFKFSAQGDYSMGVDVSFSVDPAKMGLPVGLDPTNVTYGLAAQREVDGEVVYELVDRMHYENGKLVTHSPPFFGLLGPFEDLLILPLIFAMGESMTVHGTVTAAEISGYDPDGTPIVRPGGIDRPVPGAVVTAASGSITRVLGRMSPGTVFSTAGGTNAAFTMMVQVVSGSAVFSARHPSFPGQSPGQGLPQISGQERLALGNFFNGIKLSFALPLGTEPDSIAPFITFSHGPENPPPGSDAVLKVVATDNAHRPTILLRVTDATSLAPGTNITLSQVTLSKTNTEEVGLFGRRDTYLVRSPLPSRVVLEAEAFDSARNTKKSTYQIKFGGSTPLPAQNIPVSDPKDTTGPLIVFTSPSFGNTAVAPGQALYFTFNKPIDRSILADPSSFTIYPAAQTPILNLSRDQLTLSVVYYDLQPATEYTVSVPTVIQDLAGHRFDQNPLVPGNDSYSFTFRTASQPDKILSTIQNGGGSVILGNYAYVLEKDRVAGAGIKIFDLSNPLDPQLVGEKLISGGYPRDLLLIPKYTYKRWKNLPARTNDLLVVIGGEFGGDSSQYLRVYELRKSDPTKPRRIASATLAFGGNSGVTRVQWSAPQLGYLEVGDVPSVSLIDLQTLILSDYVDDPEPEEPADEFSARLAESKLWPKLGTPGLDANGDGDYVDPGDLLPSPARESPDFPGKTYTLTLVDTVQSINDFAMEKGGTFIGVAADAGYMFGTNGLPDTNAPVFSAYRTLLNGEILEREPASINFTNGRARRLKSLFNFPLPNTNGITTVADLMLVAVRMNQGFEDGKTNRLFVIDVTDPLGPKILSEIHIPATDSISAIMEREDGVILVGVTTNLFLLDPARITEPQPASGPHPSLLAVMHNIGEGGRTFGASASGLIASTSGFKINNSAPVNKVTVSTPRIEFVSFTNAPFTPLNLRTNPGPQLEAIMGQRDTASVLFPSFLSTDTDCGQKLTNHYYALIHLPGGAGDRIELGLEALDDSRQAIKPKGYLFPPVHCLSASALTDMDRTPQANDAPVRSCSAWRLSADKLSPLYNMYLSRPIVMVGEELSQSNLTSLAAQLDREVLWSGRYLRAVFDPSMRSNPLLASFVSSVDPLHKSLLPGSEAVMDTVPGDYIQSPNPGPVTGGVMVETALNAIAPQSGELIIDTTDIQLPGRRLPIDFRRNYSAQGLFNGPFGRGWDFNYNQRVVELHESRVPVGTRFVQVCRGAGTNSEVAGSSDIIFYTGAGRTIVYAYAGTNAPPEIAADPLVQELGWTNKVARYYRPPPGAFNFFCKFKDGRYARLEADGMQYWYTPAGKLAKVYDRFDENSLEMVYNSRGELIRILDELKRELEIGYWRLATDRERRPLVDVVTANARLAGRIALLRDYSNRDILFYYNADGTLDRREGPRVETVANGSFQGRQITRYHYSPSPDPAISGRSLIGVTASDSAASPLVSATELGLKGRDTVSKVRIANRETSVSLSHDNKAKSLISGTATTKVTTPDASELEYTFDSSGRPTRTALKGVRGQPEETLTEYYPNGLLKSVTHPEGNKVDYFYDSGNPSLRSRGNLVRIVKTPGPRGGPNLDMTSHFDPWYNLPEGDMTDFNGNVSTIVLNSDHRSTWYINKSGEREIFSVNEFGLIETQQTIDNIVRGWTYNSDGFIERVRVGTLEYLYSYAPISGGTSDQTRRGLAGTITDPNGVVTQSLYDERNQLVRESRDGSEEEYVYDEGGHLIETRTKVASNRTQVDRNYYNQLGFITSNTVENVEVDGVPQTIGTVYVPDELNRVKEVILPNGGHHFYEYDHAGRLVEQRSPGAITEDYVYDRNGNLVARRIGSRTITYTYDGHDRLVATIGPNGSVTQFQLDNNGNILGRQISDAAGHVLLSGTSTVDALNRYRTVTRARNNGTVTSRYDYDSTGRSVQITDGLGAVSTGYNDDAGREVRQDAPHRTARFGYDGDNNLVSQTSIENGVSYTEQFGYNKRNQLTGRTNAVGASSHFQVELDGRVVQSIDREGHVATNAYTLGGEITTESDPNQVKKRFQYSAMRQTTLLGDSAGHEYRYEYDEAGRLLTVTLPNNEVTRYENYNDLLQPERIVLPRGVSIDLTYDLSGNISNRVIHGWGPDRPEHYAYDGLERPILLSDPNSSTAYEWDLFGFIRKTTSSYSFLTDPPPTASFSYAIEQNADNGGFRTSFIYPDPAVSVQLQRDQVGRLTAFLPTNAEPVIANVTYAGANVPGVIHLGQGRITLENSYDALQQLVARTYRRDSDGKLLASFRYAYDKSGMQLARQSVHKAGRADFFQYDPGYRLTRADFGARPGLVSSEAGRLFPGFQVPVGISGAWAAGQFARSMTYDEEDVFLGIATANPDAIVLPPQASVFGAADEFLHVGTIDGFSRTRDEVGNVTRARLGVRLPGAVLPALVPASLSYNALGQVTRIDRDDGVTVLNEYDMAGLRIRRKVSGPASLCVPSDTAFLYDGDRVVEERDLANGGAVNARYYYGDEGDELIAADMRAGGSANLTRHYFLTDNLWSVVGLTDASGQLVERMEYDAWGQPRIEALDAAAPRVSRVLVETNNLLIVFSETVLPAFDTTPDPVNFVNQLRAAGAAFEVRSGGNPVEGVFIYEESFPGAIFGSTFRFQPNQPQSGVLQLKVVAGGLQDSWNNTNLEENISVDLATPSGTSAFTGVAQGSTAPMEIGRSTAASSFLFHGQYFDYDAGLIYCRARWYDPVAGMFLQRDPAGMGDSVNQYAGFSQNPVNLRDPTGSETWISRQGHYLKDLASQYNHKEDGISGYIVSQGLNFVGSVMTLGEGTAEGWEKMNSTRQGSFGLLDRMRGAELVFNDARVAAAAFGAMRAVAKGVTSRVQAMRAAAANKRMDAERARGFLHEKGLSRMEVDGFINGMREYKKKYKANSVEVSIRDFGEKAQTRRMNAEAGSPAKGVTIKAKTGSDAKVSARIHNPHSGAVGEKSFNSDTDLFDVKINGRRASNAEVSELSRMINREQAKAHKKLGLAGLPNVSIQHGAHTKLPSLYGRSVAGKRIDLQALEKVGHPGDAFAIRMDGSGSISTSQVSRREIQQAIKEIGAQFRYRSGFQLPNSWNQFKPSISAQDFLKYQHSMFQ